MIVHKINSKKLLMLPMRIVQIYLSISVVLYIFGPYKWETHNPFLLYMYLFILQIALYYGYKISINKRYYLNISQKNLNNVPKLLSLMIVAYFLASIFNLSHFTGIQNISFDSLHEAFMAGILDPGEQYKGKMERLTSGIGTQMSTLFSPLWWSALPLSLIYFKKIKRYYKFLIILSIGLQMLSWTAIGTNSGFVDMLIVFSSVMLIILIRKLYYGDFNQSVSFNKMMLKYSPFYLFLIILGLSYFSNTIEGRLGDTWDNFWVASSFATINFDSVLMKICPMDYEPLFVFLCSYLNQGYYALSIALTLPWTPMFGLGSSMFLIEKLSPILGIQLSTYTYNAKVSDISDVNFKSAYLEFSNDFHFIGTIFLMFVIGYYFGAIVKDVIVRNNPIAVVIFCLFAIMFFYLPANNHLGLIPSTSITFCVLTVLWIFQYSKVSESKKI